MEQTTSMSSVRSPCPVTTSDIDRDRARLALDFDALPGQFIERPSVAFQRRIHRRDLEPFAAQGGKRLLESVGVECRHVDFDDRLPFGIARVRRDTEPHGGAVRLAAAEQRAAGLGGLAETQRQHAGGHGIERAGVAGLLGLQVSAHALQRLGGRESLRLIEQDDAVHRPPAPARRGGVSRVGPAHGRSSSAASSRSLS